MGGEPKGQGTQGPHGAALKPHLTSCETIDFNSSHLFFQLFLFGSFFVFGGLVGHFETGSHCSSGCPGTHCVGFELPLPLKEFKIIQTDMYH